MDTQGKRLKHARELRGVTQADLARHLGVSRTATSQWELGAIAGIEAGKLLKIAKFLRVTPDWLVNGEGEMETTKALKGDIDLNLMGQIIMEVLSRNLSLPPEGVRDLCLSIYEYLKDADTDSTRASAEIIKLTKIFGK